MFFSPLVYAQISLSNRIQHCLKSGLGPRFVYQGLGLSIPKPTLEEPKSILGLGPNHQPSHHALQTLLH